MAVYCGTCGCRLSGGWENGGHFKVSTNFQNGWSTDEKTGRPTISDTCEDCARELSTAVGVAATAIAARNQSRIRQLKAEIADSRQRAADHAKDRQEFEAEFPAWQARRREKGK
jgi:hypothetical protein